ncbi:hypothetical protein GH714_012053 [Hevea brasiliensis]|uniref:Uncharacterized protein n=1 Tax=Hevea brasiliensis TaxID=3981 RepID=A0A6A6MVC9_HEVBR|nr:hypothetical protein GH714_012053 [Hevea brasiliensis]
MADGFGVGTSFYSSIADKSHDYWCIDCRRDNYMVVPSVSNFREPKYKIEFHPEDSPFHPVVQEFFLGVYDEEATAAFNQNLSDVSTLKDPHSKSISKVSCSSIYKWNHGALQISPVKLRLFQEERPVWHTINCKGLPENSKELRQRNTKLKLEPTTRAPEDNNLNKDLQSIPTLVVTAWLDPSKDGHNEDDWLKNWRVQRCWFIQPTNHSLDTRSRAHACPHYKHAASHFSPLVFPPWSSLHSLNIKENFGHQSHVLIGHEKVSPVLDFKELPTPNLSYLDSEFEFAIS